MAQAIPHDGTGRVPTVAPTRYHWTGSASGVRLGRILNIEIELDFSVLIIFGLIVFNLGAGLLRSWHPGWSAALMWTVATLTGVAFMASILAHELSHALVGRLFDVKVERITLFMFGGVAHLKSEPRRPVDELFMAAAGPIASFVIGFAAITAALLLGVDTTVLADPRSALSRMSPIATVLLWLGPVNVILALFNLVPGFPLDGGRVLRAALWWLTADLRAATRWAALAGRIVAALMIGSGLSMALGLHFPVLGGGLVNGLWLMLIGWFLGGAARSSYRELLTREALRNLPVSRLMLREVKTVDPSLGIEHFVRDRMLRDGQRCFPVVRGDRLEGLVCIPDLRKLAAGQWAHATVRDIMTPAADLAVIGPESDAEEALRLLADRDVNQLPVVAGEKFMGLVQRGDLISWIGLALVENERARSGTPLARIGMESP
jgi:Zn-dependent protease